MLCSSASPDLPFLSPSNPHVFTRFHLLLSFISVPTSYPILLFTYMPLLFLSLDLHVFLSFRSYSLVFIYSPSLSVQLRCLLFPCGWLHDLPLYISHIYTDAHIHTSELQEKPAMCLLCLCMLPHMESITDVLALEQAVQWGWREKCL